MFANTTPGVPEVIERQKKERVRLGIDLGLFYAYLKSDEAVQTVNFLADRDEEHSLKDNAPIILSETTRRKLK